MLWCKHLKFFEVFTTRTKLPWKKFLVQGRKAVEQQANQPPDVEVLAKELQMKISIPERAAKKVKFSNMMKSKVRIAKQFVIMVKVLLGKLNATTLKAGLYVARSPCKIVQFKEVTNRLELHEVKLFSQEQTVFAVERQPWVMAGNILYIIHWEEF